MVHLNQKDSSDHSGVESYIFDRFHEGDICWIPRQKALCLQHKEEEADGNEGAEGYQIQMKEWQGQLTSVNKYLEQLLERIKNKEEQAIAAEKAAAKAAEGGGHHHDHGLGHGHGHDHGH